MIVIPKLKKITLTTKKEVFLATRSELMFLNILWAPVGIIATIGSCIIMFIILEILFSYVIGRNSWNDEPLILIFFIALVFIGPGIIAVPFFANEKVKDFRQRLKNTNELYDNQTKKEDLSELRAKDFKELMVWGLRRKEYREFIAQLRDEQHKLIDKRYSSNF